MGTFLLSRWLFFNEPPQQRATKGEFLISIHKKKNERVEITRLEQNTEEKHKRGRRHRKTNSKINQETEKNKTVIEAS